MLSGFSGVSGSNIPYNEAKSCYSEKDISDYAGYNENNSSDESFIEKERNPFSSKKKPNTVKVSLFMCHRGIQVFIQGRIASLVAGAHTQHLKRIT